jgi:two-component system, NarL family, response regulator NreC
MIRILLADDHTIVRDALRGLLESSGKYKVVGSANNGSELVQLALSNVCELIIMDISMPELSGVDATKTLRSKECKTPILALSANDDAQNVKSVLAAGANGYVPKNASLSELEFAIGSVLGGKSYLSPSVTNRIMEDPEGIHSQNSPLKVLTKREVEILISLADGKKNSEIGKSLHISTRTVDTHRSNILKKLGLRTNAELVKLAISEGLLKIG